MSIATFTSKHALDMCDRLKYQGDDPRILNALERLRPITWNMANPAQVEGIGNIRVIDGLIAVVDGRIDLQMAFKQARQLIETPRFKAVVIVRDQDTLAQSVERIHSSLYDNNIFGRSLSEGTVLTWPEKKKFLLEKPTPLMSRSHKTFQHNSCAFWRAAHVLGQDLTDIFKAARLPGAFPEFLSWNLLNGKKTSAVGILHFDKTLCQPHPIKLPIKLPKAFLKAVQSEQISTLLPGSLAMTVALRGNSTILTSSEGSRLPKASFIDAADEIGYFAMNGSISIIRGGGWPDDPKTGLPRDPVYHCSPFINFYGNLDAHKGRIIAETSACKNYASPHLYDKHGWDAGLDLPEIYH
jgi:hypothetical protein